MPTTGIVTSPLFVEHDTGPYHPETPQRLVVIGEVLRHTGLIDRLVRLPLRDATKEELLAIHKPWHIESIESTQGMDFAHLDLDTPVSARSYEAAVLAAGSCCEAVEQIQKGAVNNAFALVRPPGHHAETDKAMGFCLFNNIAVAAQYAVDKHGLKRVAIVDWDVHHGNGTQHSFYDTDRVLYISTHRSPFYPGTGDFREVGSGSGEGYTLNLPLTAGLGDGDYIALFDSVICPVLMEYEPELILVSAGFDTHKSDPLGGMRCSNEGFEQMAMRLLEVAENRCDGKIMFFLEGGYDLQGQAESIHDVLQLMLTEHAQRQKKDIEPENPREVGHIIDRAISVQMHYWEAFAG